MDPRWLRSIPVLLLAVSACSDEWTATEETDADATPRDAIPGEDYGDFADEEHGGDAREDSGAEAEACEDDGCTPVPPDSCVVASSVVYDMEGPHCPNASQHCDFAVGALAITNPSALPMVLMATGYDVKVFHIEEFNSTTQSWRQDEFRAFGFRDEYASLNRILHMVDVDPFTEIGLAPYQDKPVRIFELFGSRTVGEIWRNPFDGSYPNIGLHGVLFSLPWGSSRKIFAAWTRENFEFFEILIEPWNVQVERRHDTGFQSLEVAIRRGNPTYIYATDMATRAIIVLRASLDSSGNLQVTRTATLVPADPEADIFMGVALDESTGRLYAGARRLVHATRVSVECWETDADPGNPHFRSAFFIPRGPVLDSVKVLAARDGLVAVSNVWGPDHRTYQNNPISFADPDAPHPVPVWTNFPLPASDTTRYPVSPSGASIFRAPDGAFGVVYPCVEWASLAWIASGCVVSR